MSQSHERPGQPENLNPLTQRQLQITQLMDGSIDGKTRTMREVAEELHISRRAVQKLTKRAVLRDPSLHFSNENAIHFTEEELDLLPEGNTKRLMRLKEGYTDGVVRSSNQFAKEFGISKQGVKRIKNRAKAALKAISRS